MQLRSNLYFAVRDALSRLAPSLTVHTRAQLTRAVIANGLAVSDALGNPYLIDPATHRAWPLSVVASEDTRA